MSEADRRVAVLLFLTSAATFLLLSNGVAKSSDETSLRLLAEGIVEEQTITVPELPFVGVPGSGGRIVSKYGIGQPIASVPFVLLGHAVAAPLERPDAVVEAVTVAVTPLATAGLLAWTFLLMRRVGGTPADSAGLAVAAVLGTFALVYGTEYFAEPLVAMLMVGCVERAGARRWTAAFALLAAAMVVHPRAAPLAAILAVVAWREAGLRTAVRAMWPAVVAVLVLLGYSWARFGDPLETGYTDEGFTTPFLEGASHLLIGRTKGVLLFAPLVVGIVLLPRMWRRHRTETLLIGGFTASVFALSATWHSWTGGWSWGPRFLLPIVALCVVPLAPWLARDRVRWGIVLVVAVAGFMVSLPALVVPSTAQKDIPGDPSGPRFVQQYRLLPEVVEAGLSGGCADRFEGYPPADCLPAAWQVHVARSVGAPGDVAVVALSVVLLTGAATAASRCVAAVRAHPGHVGLRRPATLEPASRP